MPLFIIRPLIEADLPALVALYRELYHVPTDPDRMRESFRLMAANPDTLVIGAFTGDGELVGSGLLLIQLDMIAQCRPWAMVENVITAERVRGQGLGRLLMEHLEEAARQRGCSYIQLTSSNRREQAHRFYKAIGYSDQLVTAFRKGL